MDPSLVGLHSNSRSNPEASRPAVNISSEVKWFHARREVCDLREEPRRRDGISTGVDMPSRCQRFSSAPDGAAPPTRAAPPPAVRSHLPCEQHLGQARGQLAAWHRMCSSQGSRPRVQPEQRLPPAERQCTDLFLMMTVQSGVRRLPTPRGRFIVCASQPSGRAEWGSMTGRSSLGVTTLQPMKGHRN
jgi:hypothetical protein